MTLEGLLINCEECHAVCLPPSLEEVHAFEEANPGVDMVLLCVDCNAKRHGQEAA